jgi:hypothetical protein
MSSFSVGSLPAFLPLAAPGLPVAPARVVLTGPGGGTFDLAGAGAAGPPPAATLVVDVVDYCRLATRRVEIDEVDIVVEGDEALGRGLLAAARVLAV